jgi:CheY-like chemotaxis protein
MGEKNKKILLVEDDQNIRNMYLVMLKSIGLDLITASDGQEGLVKARQELPDLILLDVIMTKIDGFTVLEELKKDDSTKNIPVVLLTNLGTDEDKQKGKDLGAVDYLIKSNTTAIELKEKIKEYLE